MAFDQATRNRLQSFVSSARNILSQEFTRQLQADYGMDPKQGTVADLSTLTHLDNSQRQTAQLLRDTLEHYLATTPGKSDKERTKQVLERIIREQAFTVLNRLAALRMAEAREFLIESIGKSQSSKGFQLYRQLAGTSHGETGDAYRNYLFSLFDEFSVDLAVLFDRHSIQGRLFPRESALLELLAEINHQEIDALWAEDETIGWIYQYFNSQEERKKMRAESQAPRNSRELAVRNQFFTPRYVVEFLTDNTLGRIWYEMTQGKTALVDSCSYLVRRPTEVFLKPGDQAPDTESTEDETLSQEELLQQPVYIPHRKLKDPRSIRMLDPACGSMHFGLYAFDLFELIYLEAWQLEQELGPDAFQREANQQSLQASFSSLDEFKTQIPKLIIENNIHGVDIDPRAVQIAGLSLWQRAQRAWQLQGVKPQQRPVIVRSNIVCAEPMPGDKALLKEFTSQLNPPVLGQLLEVIFDKMQLAGEAGTLLKIEEEIQTAIKDARNQWQNQSGRNSVSDMFQTELDAATPQQKLGFDLRGIDEGTFWDDAEQLILNALHDYAAQAESTADQKRLFAEDAAKGFAFIDLCHKRFDVVLMNPPFGQAATSTRNLLEKNYPEEKSELAACFISRGSSMSLDKAKVGCLATRLLLSLPSYENWRRSEFLYKNSLSLTADLGYGVLDAAVVEAAAYIQTIGAESEGIFIDCLQERDKQLSLITKINSSSELKSIPLRLFSFLPASVIAHFVDIETIKNIALSDNLLSHGVRGYKGINTSDDFRFLRLSWENLHQDRADYWRKFAKGGEWNPFWDDIHLEVNWHLKGEEIKSAGGTIRNPLTQGLPGLTYPERTTSSFGPRIMPVGTIYSSAGMGILAEKEEDTLPYLSVLLSREGQFLIELSLSGGDSSVSGTAARHYTNGMINRLPIPKIDIIKDTLTELTEKIVLLKRKTFYKDETSREFCFINNVYDNLKDYIRKEILMNLESLLKQSFILNEIDFLINPIFGFSEDEIKSVVGENIWKFDSDCNSKEVIELYLLTEAQLVNKAHGVLGGARYVTKNSQLLDRKIELISHTLKITPFIVINKLIESIDLIVSGSDVKEAALEVSSILFGKIFNINKFKSTNKYNTFIVREDAESNPGLSIIAIEKNKYQKSSLEEMLSQEVLKIIPSCDFESLLNKTGSRNITDFSIVFFEYHLLKYSKSRRQAPLYWPLQTASGSYTLWLYYHRLSEQTLYTCINDFVEPHLASVVESLSTLHNKIARNSQEEKDLAQLTDSEAELKDFRDELLRLAKFWKPNLNDGVQITAAPLWKLFQHKAWQKKLKDTWEKLEDGDYDWAHLACSIWPERVLRKCHQDRSLAIAHDVEDIFWHEVEVPVKRGAKLTGEMKTEWQPKSLTAAELTELINQTITELK